MTKPNKKKNEDIVDVSNLFNRGVLVIFDSRCWGATAQMDVSQLPDEMDKESTKSVQDLLLPEDKKLLKVIKSVSDSTKRFIESFSVPHPMTGVQFIPKSALDIVTNEIEKDRRNFFNMVDRFCENVESAQLKLKETKPNLWRAKKFLTSAQIKARFKFEYILRVLAVPDESLSVLSPEAYKKEIEKAKAEVEEIKDMTVALVSKKMIELVTRLQQQCEDSKINSRTIGSINQLLEKFDSVWSGFVDSKKLRSVINDVKEYMEGTDAEMLRIDDDFRDIIGDKMEDLTKEISEIPQFQKRYLDI